MAYTRTLVLSLTAPFLAGILVGSFATGVGAAMKGSAIFVDVPEDSPANKEIGEMYARRIMTGVDSRHFNPNDAVTNAQLAVFLKRLRDDIVSGSVASAVPAPAPAAASASTPGALQASLSTVSVRRSSASRSSSNASAGKADAGAGTLHFTLATLTIPETVPRVSVSIVRTDGARGSVSVDYATTDGTAVAGTNYQKSTGSVTFADGETIKILSITLTHASPLQANASFSFTLSNPRGGAALGTPSAVRIALLAVNPSAPLSSTTATSANGSTAVAAGGASTLSLSAAAYGFMENGGTATVTVTRDGGSTGSVSVNYATNEGSAQAGKDYTTTTGTLTFNAGETSKTFSIPIIDNGTMDGNRKFNLTLSAPSGEAVLGRSSAPVTLVDDETTKNASGVFQFGSSDYIGSKGTSMLVTVTRVGGNAGAVTVDFATADASAISGSDYAAAKGTLAFAAGETSKAFAVTISVNAKPDKAFTLLLSNATGGATISIDSARSTMTLQ
ncbi:S-layer homology domain-containing protein [Candidatus Peregrinibacteria bacterium]|nr:S-layer homology domain-containing protein [Candidatus Peregrinibacteria bacterium]MBI3816597.1 S-layer homology domain-containing protein [Candidatus Peregrinibacteria bacterium]